MLGICPADCGADPSFELFEPSPFFRVPQGFIFYGLVIIMGHAKFLGQFQGHAKFLDTFYVLW